MPSRILISVVLPAPFGPSKQKISPRGHQESHLSKHEHLADETTRFDTSWSNWRRQLQWYQTSSSVFLSVVNQSASVLATKPSSVKYRTATAEVSNRAEVLWKRLNSQSDHSKAGIKRARKLSVLTRDQTINTEWPLLKPPQPGGLSAMKLTVVGFACPKAW